MAREVVDHAMRELRHREGRPRRPEARTDEEPLPGGETADLRRFASADWRSALLPESVEHLLRHYGTEAAGIYNLGGGDRRLFRRLLPPHPAIEAEVLHAVRRELAQTVEDVLVRRLHLYYEHPERGIPAARRVAELMGRELGLGRGSDRAGGGAVPGVCPPVRRANRACSLRLDDAPDQHAGATRATMVVQKKS